MTTQTPIIPAVSPNEPQSGWWNWLQSLARTINLIIDWIHAQPAPGSGGTGDISAVTAGTGLTGGGTAGDVTLALSVPVAVAHGGTDATTAPAALANLGGAPLASPVFTGDPRAPTPTAGDSDTSIATTAFVAAAVAAGGGGGGLTEAAADLRYVNITGDTMSGPLNVGTGSLTYAAIYGDATMGEIDLTGGSVVGFVGVGAAGFAAGTSTNNHTTFYVNDTLRLGLYTDGTAGFSGALSANSLVLSVTPLAVAYGGTGATTAPTALANLGGAPLASPTFTGDPKAPTPATADNDTSIATTAYVQAQGYQTGNQTITLSGDLSGSGTTAINAQIVANAVGTAEIADANVTYAKVQNVTGARLLGNPTGSAAAPSEISLGTNLSFAGNVLNATGGGGSGTVTSVAAGTGLTASPSPIVGAGTLSLSVPVTVANGGTGLATLSQYHVLAGNGTSAVSPLVPGSNSTILRSNGPSAMPSYSSLSALLDVMVGTAARGQILYRDSAAWSPLAPGTAGLFLRTGGAGANPTWAGAAPLDSPAFTGTPSLPTGTTGITQAQNVANTTLATTAFTRVGTATNNNAAAGQLGEFISAEIAGPSAVAMTTAVTRNITSISLTAGDWDVWGSVGFVSGAATVAGFSSGGISTTTAAFPTPYPGSGGMTELPFASQAGYSIIFPVGTRRLSLSATTTVYLVAYAEFTGGTLGGSGGIYARRVR